MSEGAKRGALAAWTDPNSLGRLRPIFFGRPVVEVMVNRTLLHVMVGQASTLLAAERECYLSDVFPGS